jgi:hypothetical protein
MSLLGLSAHQTRLILERKYVQGTTDGSVRAPPSYSGPEIHGQMLLNLGLDEDFKVCHLRTNVNPSNRSKGRLSLRNLLSTAILWL